MRGCRPARGQRRARRPPGSVPCVRPSRQSSARFAASRAPASCRCSSSTLAPTDSRSVSNRAAASSASLRAIARRSSSLPQIVARLLFARAATMQLGQRQAQLVAGLHEPGHRVAILSRAASTSASAASDWGKPQVGGVRRQPLLAPCAGPARPRCHARPPRPAFRGRARSSRARRRRRDGRSEASSAGARRHSSSARRRSAASCSARASTVGELAGKLPSSARRSRPSRRAASRSARRVADIGRHGLAPGAGQRAEAEAAVGRNPGLSLGRIVRRAGDARTARCSTTPAETGCRSAAPALSQSAREQDAAALQQLSVVQQRAAVTVAGDRRGDPGIEQAGGFECGFETGAFAVGQRSRESPPVATAARRLDVVRASACACVGQGRRASTPASRRRRSSSRAAALGLQGLASIDQQQAALGQLLGWRAAAPPAAGAAPDCRPPGSRPTRPGQPACRRPPSGSTTRRRRPAKWRSPRLDQDAALAFDPRIGLLRTLACGVGIELALVPQSGGSARASPRLFPARHAARAAGDLLAPSRHKRMQPIGGGVEARARPGAISAASSSARHRVCRMGGGDAGGLSLGSAVAAQAGPQAFARDRRAREPGRLPRCCAPIVGRPP